MKNLSYGPLTLLSFFLLTACAPAGRQYQALAEPGPPREVSTEVYFYPNHGQSMEQQDRDRYECYRWAKQQTGFDPSAPRLAPHQRVQVVPQPAPGHDMAVGAFTGAVLGAAIGAPHGSGEGALIGAIAGATLGAVSDAARQERADEIQGQYDRQAMGQYAERDRQASSYRRAMSACLEGRGYSVR